jgi:hypothetical protein
LEVAKKIEAKLILGELHLLNETEIQTPSFQEYAENWMTFTVPATCKPSTEKDYRAYWIITYCLFWGTNQSWKLRCGGPTGRSGPGCNHPQPIRNQQKKASQ